MTSNDSSVSLQHRWLPRCRLLLSLALLAMATDPATSFSATFPTNTHPQHSSLSAALVVADSGNGGASEWYTPPPPPPPRAPSRAGLRPLQRSIHTVDDFQRFVSKPMDDDRLTIVKFYASWCKSCAKFGLKLDRFAAEHADWVSTTDGTTHVRGEVNIVHIEYGAARDLCRSLGVTKLPTVHMYRGGVQLQDFSCPPSQFARVQELTAAYLAQPHDEDKDHAITSESALETTLAQGHSMIQETLLEPVVPQSQAMRPEPLEPAVATAETVLTDALTTEHDNRATAAPTLGRRRRLWNKLRRRSTTTPGI